LTDQSPYRRIDDWEIKRPFWRLNGIPLSPDTPVLAVLYEDSGDDCVQSIKGNMGVVSPARTLVVDDAEFSITHVGLVRLIGSTPIAIWAQKVEQGAERIMHLIIQRRGTEYIATLIDGPAGDSPLLAVLAAMAPADGKPV
jgi:hypothetical protein